MATKLVPPDQIPRIDPRTVGIYEMCGSAAESRERDARKLARRRRLKQIFPFVKLPR
jgi:hypothetical protein